MNPVKISDLTPLLVVSTGSPVSKSYHDQLLPLITGSKVSALSRANFAKTMLILPPTIAEQRAIAEVLAAADAEIAALEAKREKYKKIKAGMMRDLLSGRVRV